jgi:putative transposase
MVLTETGLPLLRRPCPPRAPSPRPLSDQVRPKLPKVAALLDGAGRRAGLYEHPKEHRAKLHSTDEIERVNRDFKRRTEVVGILPNEAAITRPVRAILLE